MLITLKGFTIGVAISATAITVIDLIFSNGNYANRIFIVNPTLYLFITAVAFLMAILVPINCEIISKIQPKDAMK